MGEYNDIAVKVVRNKGYVSVVEWSDGSRTKRTIVPRSELQEDNGKFSVTSDTLEMGIPYGVDWEHRIPQDKYLIRREDIARQLEASGIWTKEDYDKNPSVINSAVLAAAREILTDLYAVVRSIPKQEE